jgi:hypothetical protein
MRAVAIVTNAAEGSGKLSVTWSAAMARPESFIVLRSIPELINYG